MFIIELTDDGQKIAEFKSQSVYKVLQAITYIVYKKYGR